MCRQDQVASAPLAQYGSHITVKITYDKQNTSSSDALGRPTSSNILAQKMQAFDPHTNAVRRSAWWGDRPSFRLSILRIERGTQGDFRSIRRHD